MHASTTLRISLEDLIMITCFLVHAPFVESLSPWIGASKDREYHMPPVPDARLRLVQLDPVKVGHIHTIELEPDMYYQVRTAAVKPPIFVISDFLTPEEYDRIKDLAETKGLQASRTVFLENVDNSIDSTRHSYFNVDTFEDLDTGDKGYLDMEETRRALNILEGIPPMDNLTFRRLIDTVIDLDSNRELEDVEFRRIPLVMKNITDWIAHHGQSDGRLTPGELKKLESGPMRLSRQVWIPTGEYDPTDAIRKRIIKLTGLHPDIVMTSEDLQVVRYTAGGHFHAHHDTTEFKSDQPCYHTRHLYPHQPNEHLQMERLCRYITLLYYLADTDEGGETAFPAADNETYSARPQMGKNGVFDPKDLTHHCKDANLYIRPKKGLAVMWYNHYLDEKNGWLGNKNDFSLHGGCEVIKGEKWIANNWITVDNNREIQMAFHREKLHRSYHSTGTEEKPSLPQKKSGIVGALAPDVRISTLSDPFLLHGTGQQECHTEV